MQLMPRFAHIPLPPVSASVLYEETRFWIKTIHSWKNIIGRIIDETGNVNASPEITAEVAKTAGELSLLEDRLNPLLHRIEFHSRRLLVAGAEPKHKIEHELLQTHVLEEGTHFKNLLAKIFQLEDYAYKKFLS